MTSPPQGYLSVRWPLFVGAATLLLLIVGFGAWSVTTTIASAIAAQGRVDTTRHRHVIQHQEGGIVDQIHVSEGTEVARGHILLTLDRRNLQEQRDLLDERLFVAQARLARAKAMRDQRDAIDFAPALPGSTLLPSTRRELLSDERDLFQSWRVGQTTDSRRLTLQRRQIQAQRLGAAALRHAQEVQLALIEQELRDQQALLDRGLAQTRTVWRLKRARAELQGALAQHAISDASAQAELAELDANAAKVKADGREEALRLLSDMRAQQAALVQQRNRLERELERSILRAPIDGQVFGLAISQPQAVIQASQPLMSIIPKEAPIAINVQIAPRQRDSVFLGQEVTLRLTALDHRVPPRLTGVVSHISADVVSAPSSAAHYQVDIALASSDPQNVPHAQHLRPGMPVEVFLRTGDQTPIVYLVRPFVDYFTRAFREG
ncbi:MAG: HlyD family type I secretion periplasmic adaptor subunit [Pseudomonadota bacterium]